MLPDLSEEELAGLDALIDEPEDDAPAAASGVDAGEPSTAVAGGGESATQIPDRETAIARQGVRLLLSSVDGVLWAVDDEHLSVAPGATFSALVEARERALRGTPVSRSGTP